MGGFQNKATILAGLLGLALVLGSAWSAAESIYQIGNSLTIDSSPTKIAAMAQAAGFDAVGGYHTRGGASVTSIWNQPSPATTVHPDFGLYDQALPNYPWDHVILQASDVGLSTLGEEAETFERYRSLTRQNPANDQTEFYIYGAWPWYQHWGSWDTPVDASPDTPTWNRCENYARLYESLNGDEPDAW